MASSPTPNVIAPAQMEAYSILRSTPPWSKVESSLARLQNLRNSNPPVPYPEMLQDQLNVLQYTAVLQRSVDVVALAICLASHLSQFSPSQDPAPRFEDGLRALSNGLELQTLDETDTRSELNRCMRAAFPELQLDSAKLSKADTSDARDAWRASLEDALERIRAAPPLVHDDVQRAAWSAWQNRFAAFLSAPQRPEVPPDIDFLRCLAQGSRPGTVLRARLKSATVRDWSDAYIAANSSAAPCPFWCVLAILRGIGFDVSPVLSSPASVETTELVPAQQFLLKLAPAPSRRGLLVLRTDAASLTADWRTAPNLAVLTVREKDFYSAAKFDFESYFPSWLQGILIEGAPGEQPSDALERVNVKRIQSKLPKVRIGFLYPREPQPPPMPGYTFAYGPTDANSAFNQAFGTSS